MKKIIVLCILLLGLITGCVSYTELNELGIVSALGIEEIDQQIQLTANFILPQKDDGESTYQSTCFQSRGTTIEEALNNLYLQVSKKIDLAHLELVAIDTTIAQEDLNKILQFFLQEPIARNNFPIVLMKEVNAKELLENENQKDTIAHLLTMNQIAQGTTFSLSLENMARQLLEEKNTVIPVVSSKNHIPTTEGLAIIQDNKLKDYLTLEESNAYLYLSNQINSFTLIPSNSNQTSEIIVKENHTIISSHQNKIQIEIQSTIESKENNVDLKENYEKEVKKRIDSLIKKTQDNKMDLLHFLTLIYRNDYNFYEHNKTNLFEQLTYEITFHTTIQYPNLKTEGVLI